MNWLGIDLGTTNSVVCSFDGEAIRTYKSPEQNDVTPSAIYFDRRGNKYVGSRAYAQSYRDPDSSAILFKRFMGTSTPIRIANSGQTFSAEECSAEILRTLYSYPPEETHSLDAGTVITVPAAFNQMQKDATMAAAQMAGIGQVALLQEPVAAVMSVMRKRSSDGVFVIYDLGGGTLDVAIAQSISGRVSLIANGGIEMCGGRDMDRTIRDRLVTPWLLGNFDLPKTFISDPEYRNLLRVIEFAIERAKIDLSQRPSAIIAESELPFKDKSGKELYLDIELTREALDGAISSQISETIALTREVIAKANLSPHDVERLVFVGGPTQYKPLRDRVAFELGVAASSEVNPMTAVAEGAAVFGEGVEWSTSKRGRKVARGEYDAGGDAELNFVFVARTPDNKARIQPSPSQTSAVREIQVDSVDTGWSSGRIAIKPGVFVEVPLSKAGQNAFKVFAYSSSGTAIRLENDSILITRTAATIDGIPASRTIRIELLDRIGGASVSRALVQEGDSLPKSGEITLKAANSLKAGQAEALRFKLWEGDIDQPVSDNRPIGTFEIKGTDLENGVIAAGSELNLSWQMLESGEIACEVSVPSVGALFHGGRNFYSRQESQIDYSDASRRVAEESEAALQRVSDVSRSISDRNLDAAREKLEQAQTLAETDKSPEGFKQADDRIQEAKKLLAQARKDHLAEMRALELGNIRAVFEDIQEYATPNETEQFYKLSETAEREIATSRFESHLGELKSRVYTMLWRQDWYVVDAFNSLADRPHQFADQGVFRDLVAKGRDAIAKNDVNTLRMVLGQLFDRKIGQASETDFIHSVNVLAAR